MKSSNVLPTNSTRRNVGRPWILSAFLSSATAICPAIFCSCESASQSSSESRGANPYSQYEPKNAEEDAYYRDVYSGDWRNQTNPFGTGPSICKKTGSTEAPPHWSTVPDGAKSMDEIRFEAAQRKAAEARRFASAPYSQASTHNAYGAQAQLSTPQYVPQQPTPPQTPTIEYPQAQATPTAQNVQYVSQVPGATPLYPQPAPTQNVQPQPAPTQNVQPQPAPTQNVYPQPAPTQNVQPQPAPTQNVQPQPAPTQNVQPQPAPTQNVQPQPAPTQNVQPQPAPTQNVYPQPAPTQNVYPQPIYQGASIQRNSFNDGVLETTIIRGQAPKEDEEDPFANDATDDEAENEAETNNDEPTVEAETNNDEPAVELKTENVKETKVAPNASVPQPAAAQSIKEDASAPKMSGEGPSNRIGGQVLPIQIDPSIAAPFANVHRPLPNLSAPANPEAKRSTQDEYVVTGGDSKDAMFSREDWTVENLDAEDSAAHFDTVDGRILSEPSNQFFLYSPRFGAVRQIIGPIEGEQSVLLESANATTQVAQDDAAQSVDVREQETKLLGSTNAVAVGAAQSQASAAIADSSQGVIEGTSLVRLGAMLTSDSIDELDSKDSALLLQGAIAAQGWSGEQKVAIALETVNAFSNAYVAGAETIFSVKDDTKTSKLRLIKIANKDAAQPGELVEFTLRFENIGDEPIGNVTILDNLSTRLAYVAGSAKSSVQAEFLAELNEKGSLILRWEITEPLEPKDFGVVRFICKVR